MSVPVIAVFGSPPRGTAGGNYPQDAKVQSISYTASWGVNPGQGNITYVSGSDFPHEAKITAGSFVKIKTIHGHLLTGIVQKDEPIRSSTGHSRALSFIDFRDYLNWDDIYCLFNIEDKTIVAGSRQKRFKHLLPADFDKQAWWYTNFPFSAAEILRMIMIPVTTPGGHITLPGVSWGSLSPAIQVTLRANPTVESPWWEDEINHRPILHRFWNSGSNTWADRGIQNATDQYGPSYPVYNLNWEGVKLGAAIVELCDRQGLTFTLDPWESEDGTDSFYYRLRFAAKGEGALPTYNWVDDDDVIYIPTDDNKYFPQNSDNRRMGKCVSGNASRIRVLGGRNLFQVYNVPLFPDWPHAWNAVRDISDVATQLANWIAAPGSPYTGLQAALHNPTYQAAGQVARYQEAYALAESITVRQYCNFVGSPPLGNINTLYDPRKWQGRCRMDMPVKMYLEEIVFRAFRPGSPINCPSHSGSLEARPLSDLTIVPENLSTIGYVPTAGDSPMYPVVDDPYVPNGAGMVLVKGYQIGQESWKHLRPENFNLQQWTSAANIWQPIGFKLDDSGDGGQTVIMDEPVFVLAQLFAEVEGPPVAGGTRVKYTVPRAFAYPTAIPQVVATLTYAAERYSRWLQKVDYEVQKRDMTESVPSLYGEYVVYGNGWQEVLFSDGMSVDAKADRIANALLIRQFTHADGGFVRKLRADDTPTYLHPTYNRVALEYGPNGFTESIEFTQELERGYQPERDFDRWRKEERLFAGQQEMLDDARQHRMAAIGYLTLPGLAQSIQSYWNASRAPNGPTVATAITAATYP